MSKHLFLFFIIIIHTYTQACNNSKHKELLELTITKRSSLEQCLLGRASLPGKYDNKLMKQIEAENRQKQKNQTCEKNKMTKGMIIANLKEERIILSSIEVKKVSNIYLKDKFNYKDQNKISNIHKFNDILYLVLYENGSFSINRVADGKIMTILNQDSDYIIKEALLMNSNLLIIIRNSNIISIWDLDYKELINEIVFLDLTEISSVYEINSNNIIILADSKLIKINIQTLQKTIIYDNHNDNILKILPISERVVIIIEQDGNLILFDIISLEVINKVYNLNPLQETVVIKKIKDNIILIGKSNGYVEIWAYDEKYNLEKLSSFLYDKLIKIEDFQILSNNVLVIIGDNMTEICLYLLNNYNTIKIRGINTTALRNIIVVDTLKFITINSAADEIQLFGYI